MERRLYARNRIRELRQARRISLEELGSKMWADLSASTVSKLEKSRMALSADYLLDIADILKVSPIEILVEGSAEPMRSVPVIGTVSAGNWAEAIEMSEESYQIPGHLDGKNVFVLRPRGDSMDLICRDGGYVAVDPDDCELRNGRYYVIRNAESEVTFKEFCTDPFQLVPCSSNPEHKPIPLGSEPFLVVGRIIHIGFDV